MQDRQLLRVAPIGLDPLARLVRDHRRRRNNTLVPEARELAMDVVATAACLIAEVELTVPCELLRPS
jgi:hypothetical protein